MTTQESQAVPEILEKSLLRDLKDSESREKAIKILSRKMPTLGMSLIVVVGAMLASSLVNHTFESLKMSTLEKSLLVGFLTAVPALGVEVWGLKRRLNAVIQLLQLDKK